MGVDRVLFRQLGDGRRLVCGPASDANDIMRVVNSRIRFPRHCTIPLECTLAMREVDITMGWELVVFPQLNPLNNPAFSKQGETPPSFLWRHRKSKYGKPYKEIGPNKSDGCRGVPKSTHDALDTDIRHWTRTTYHWLAKSSRLSGWRLNQQLIVTCKGHHFTTMGLRTGWLGRIWSLLRKEWRGI